MSSRPDTRGAEDLDPVAFHWREALDAATDSLDLLGRSRRALRFPPAELHARSTELGHERDVTEQRLERLAATMHTHLHRHLHGPRTCAPLLGLGPRVRGCVFELEGILAPSTGLHAAAWQETLDEFLARHHKDAHGRFDPWRGFETRDYDRYFRGRLRTDGLQRFLSSRGIRVPDDGPGDDTASALAARKNEVLRRLLRQQGVRAYAGAVRFLELAHEARLARAIVSASANSPEIVERAGLLGLVDAIVDGNTMVAERLRPKPAPDAILAACRRLDLAPAETASFETTTAGIAAGRAAGVERVIGVGPGPLAGADRVVTELAELIDPRLT